MEYWVNEELNEKFGACRLELRASLAWELLSKFSITTGQYGGEDSQGRAFIKEMLPKDIVKRAFEMAESFVEIAESKGLIKPETATLNEIINRQVKVAKIRKDKIYE